MLLQRQAACHSPAPALNSIFLFGRQSHPGGSPMSAQLEQSMLVIATPPSHQNEVALQQQILFSSLQDNWTQRFVCLQCDGVEKVGGWVDRGVS